MTPTYPPLIQTCRVTSATIPGPGTSSSATSYLPGGIYVSFTCQDDTVTLLKRDREPCLVKDPNKIGLTPGYYICRLVGNYNGLPLYDAQSPCMCEEGSTTTTTTFKIPQPATQSAGSSSAYPVQSVTVSVTSTSNLSIGQIIEITDGTNTTYGTITNILNTTQFTYVVTQTNNPGVIMQVPATIIIVPPVVLNTPIQVPSGTKPPAQIYLDPFGNIATKPITSSITTQVFNIPALQSSVTINVDNTSWMTNGSQVLIQQGGNYLYGYASNITPTSFSFTLTSITGGGPGGSVGLNAGIIPISSPYLTPTTATFVIPTIGTSVNISVPSTGTFIGTTTNPQTVIVTDGTNIILASISVLNANTLTLTPISLFTGTIGNTVKSLASIFLFGTTINPLLGLPSLPTNATKGFPYLATMAGVPTGTPVNLPTGYSPIVIDSTDGRLYAYYSGVWNNLSGSGGGGSGGRYLRTIVILSGSTTYTSSSDCNLIFARVISGGGGGGGVGTGVGNAAAGGGGAGGGYCEKTIVVTPSTTYSVTIGTGGAGGTNTGGNGGNGGPSSMTVGVTTFSSSGGGGGTGDAGGATIAINAGGNTLGTASGGDVSVEGGSGFPGIRLSGIAGYAGQGGGNPLSPVGAAKTTNGAGNSGGGIGIGGSGALSLNGAAGAIGGVGIDGRIIIDEYS